MPPSRRLGQPTKLTPALQQAIVNAVAAGVSASCAGELAGLNAATVKEWIQRGEDAHPTRPSTPLYAAFAEAITQARAQAETRRVARIEQAGRGGAVVYRKTTTMADGRIITEERYAAPSWEADAWYLERSRHAEWGRPAVQKVALTTPDGEQSWEPKVVWLPEKAPTAEAWLAQVTHLMPGAASLEAEA